LCCQISWEIWRDNFIQDAPQSNAAYQARFLVTSLHMLNQWSQSSQKQALTPVSA